LFFSRDNTTIVLYPPAKGFRSYIIPSGIKTIANGAFSTSKLVNITIPDGVTTIGDYAFSLCMSLLYINIPYGVTSIGERAFASCDSIGKLVIPDSVQSMGPSAFDSCSDLVSVVIPYGLKTLEDSVFCACSRLKNVTIPDTVTSIGVSAFAYCRELKSVNIPNSVTSIEYAAFSNCKSLESFVFPSGITSVAQSVLSSCPLLANVTIPEGVKSIESSSFSSCVSLTSIHLPESLESIDTSAFSGCTGLSHITIPRNVSSIGFKLLSSCTRLTSIDVEEGNMKYESIDGVLFDKVSHNLIQYPAGKKDANYSVPNGTQSISNYAFEGSMYLERVKIPEKVVSMGYCVFSECNFLRSISFPSTLVRIPSMALRECQGLTDVTISDGIKFIDDYAFSKCTSLKKVVIPGSVTSMGNNVFDQCGSLQSVYYLGFTSIKGDIFSSCKYLVNVCVSPYYVFSTFGGVSVTPNSTTCKALTKLYNHCFEPVYVDGKFVERKLKNATSWEEQTNVCTQYYCHNQIGPLSWSMCNTTGNTSRLCMDTMCVDDYEKKIKQWTVAFAVKNVTYNDVNVEDLNANFSKLSGIQKYDINTVLETDVEGDVLNFVVPVRNENTAKSLDDAIMNLYKGENCTYGVICHINSSIIYEGPSSSYSPYSSSSASSIHDMIIKGIMILFLIFEIMML